MILTPSNKERRSSDRLSHFETCKIERLLLAGFNPASTSRHRKFLLSVVDVEEFNRREG